MDKPLIYLPSEGKSKELPFNRFLPQVSAGMISGWLGINKKPMDTILDPLGASPNAVLEMANAGYRVLVACNNPVLAFELQMLAKAIPASDLVSAIRELGDLKRGNERLEATIRNLYLTRCPGCQAEIMATGYLWNRDERYPHSRRITCPHCASSGDYPISTDDIQILQQLYRSEQMHRSRAIARVMEGNVDDRSFVEQAVSIYPIRALVVLMTLINKLAGLNLPQSRRELLEAVILSLLDEGNSLWPWPEQKEQPRQLKVPQQFLEKNLLMAFDSAIKSWSVQRNSLPFSVWPEMPDNAGICLYPGRMRDLNQEAPGLQIDAIVCAAPRPSQAFWTLCSLWASWIWGHEKASRFSQVLERRRFDWHWHTTALHAAFLPAASLTVKSIPAFILIPDPAAGFVSAVVESDAIAGYEFSGCAMRSSSEPIQLAWKTNVQGSEYKPVNVKQVVRSAMRDLLNQKGEPVEYIKLHTAALCALADNNAFPPTIQQFTNEKASEIQAILNSILVDSTFLVRLDATAQENESGFWWLANTENAHQPLADRLEVEILKWLQQDGQVSATELLQRTLQKFPGFLSPEDELISHCAESYAVLEPETQTWKIKSGEQQAIRQASSTEAARQLSRISSALRLHQAGDNPIEWFADQHTEQPVYRFYILLNALIPAEAWSTLNNNCQTIFLLPGSRAGLMKYKIARDPALRERLKNNTRFLKFRALQSIALRTDLSLDIFEVLLETDPLSMEEPAQLSMFR